MNRLSELIENRKNWRGIVRSVLTGYVVRRRKKQVLNSFLKLFREATCFDEASRLFHTFPPLYEKHLWPFAEMQEMVTNFPPFF